MVENKIIKDDFKIYCCFSNDSQDVESVIGMVFIDYLNKRLKESSNQSN